MMRHSKTNSIYNRNTVFINTISLMLKISTLKQFGYIIQHCLH